MPEEEAKTMARKAYQLACEEWDAKHAAKEGEEVVDHVPIHRAFFVADESSVRFDSETDAWDSFTCAHMEAHKGVLRCNRMIVELQREGATGSES